MAKVPLGPDPEPHLTIRSSILDPLSAAGAGAALEWMQDLQQIQKMSLLGTLAGGIAHDFNNILTAVRHAGERIAPMLPEGHPAHPLLATIHSATQRAAELNRQILTFGRRGEAARVRFDMGSLIKEAIQLLRVALPNNMKINDEITSQTWVMGDPNQIYQVFLNLAINAHNAMTPQGGELGISLCPQRLDGPAPPLCAGAYAVLTVKDSGCGMEPAVMAKIFTPFFTTKGARDGTGLGLAIAKEIIDQHGGTIEVASEPGKGSDFRVLLPVLEPEPACRP
jgi:signal transduction histidine kinase